jgi:asparagine synthetase B (glutamine-hydrolysing)
MTSPSFLAFVHDAGGDSVVEKIAGSLNPPHIRRFDLAEGRLTLCHWSEANGRTDRDGSVLVDVNMTRSTSPTPIPAKIVDAEIVPKGLLARVNQFHSYLYLDDRKRAVFWTDHVGFSKIFHLATDGCQIFSDDLSAFRPLGLAIDQGMVASFLVNGSMVAERTLYQGVQNLAQGQVVVATPHGLQKSEYWRFEPSIETGADGNDVAKNLWTRTEAAVLRHAGEHQVIVPLSGGYDSSCILAVLAAAKRDISTFTYVNGVPQPGSDADVARRQAELVGVEHRIIGIEDESFLGMLKANVNAGLNMRNANYEIATYASAVDSVKSRFPNPIMLFGEECFGGPSYRLNGNNDLLGSVILKSPERLIELEPVLGQPAIGRLRRELQRSHDSLFDSSLEGQSPKDKSDRLYFRIRMGLNAAPLLVYTAG